jgi:hypothetical protein
MTYGANKNYKKNNLKCINIILANQLVFINIFPLEIKFQYCLLHHKSPSQKPSMCDLSREPPPLQLFFKNPVTL